MTFAEVREYQYGDDIRSIDWNVTARFNHPYVKVFEEERELTVMFTDIRGFTGISERLTPEALIHLMNDFLTPMTTLVMQNRGTIDKYMGDALMAFWNAPLDDAYHARHACLTRGIKFFAAAPEDERVAAL